MPNPNKSRRAGGIRATAKGKRNTLLINQGTVCKTYEQNGELKRRIKELEKLIATKDQTICELLKCIKGAC